MPLPNDGSRTSDKWVSKFGREGKLPVGLVVFYCVFDCFVSGGRVVVFHFFFAV